MISEEAIKSPDGLHEIAKMICDMAEPLVGDDPQAIRESRDVENPLAAPPRGLHSIQDRMLAGPGGDLPVRIYTPQNFTSGAALVYYHGGGWVIGTLNGYDTVCQTLADESGYKVISVDYRLAPETRYPGAVDDAFFAYNWVLENCQELGVSADRVAVAGDSAGGNLSIATVLRAQEQKVRQPTYQLLYYPVTDARCDSPSMEEFADGYVLTKEAMDWFVGHYVEDPDHIREPQCSPVFIEDFSTMSPGMVITAGFDPLRDEGFDFAKACRDAGVEMPHYCFTDMIHGFISFAGGVQQGMQALQMGADALKAKLD